MTKLMLLPALAMLPFVAGCGRAPEGTDTQTRAATMEAKANSIEAMAEARSNEAAATMMENAAPPSDAALRNETSSTNTSQPAPDAKR